MAFAIWLYGALVTLSLGALSLMDKQSAGQVAGPIGAGLVLLAIIVEVRRVRRR